MDPYATYADWIACFSDLGATDWDRVGILADAYDSWIERDGFPIRLGNDSLVLRLCADRCVVETDQGRFAPLGRAS